MYGGKHLYTSIEPPLNMKLAALLQLIFGLIATAIGLAMLFLKRKAFKGVHFNSYRPTSCTNREQLASHDDAEALYCQCTNWPPQTTIPFESNW